MKRNVKNEKVLKAIAIGLATMIAATSAPVNVLAADGDPETPVVEGGNGSNGDNGNNGDNENNGGSGNEDGSGSGDDTQQDTNNSVEVTDENVKAGIDAANGLFNSATDSIEPVFNENGVATDGGLLPVAINAAVSAGQTINSEDGITTASEDLITAAGAVAETEQDLKAVKDALGNLGQQEAAPFVYEENADVLASTKDENGDEHLKTKTETDENGDVISETPDVFDADGNIVLQAPTDGGLLVASFYDDYKEAIKLANQRTEQSLEDANKIADATGKKLEQEKAKVENLKEAIKDSAAAERAVAAAKDKLNRIENIRTKYEQFMETYYKQINGRQYKSNDFVGQANLVSEKDNQENDTQDNNYYDASNAGNSFTLGNELTKMIVELELLEEGAYNISWVDGKAKPKEGKPDGPQVGEISNGRYNYLTVNYTDMNGKPGVKYVNDIFKDSFYSNKENDRQNGVIYISERFDTNNDGKPDTKWQAYDPTSTKYYDNYAKIPTKDALTKAQEAVAAAEENSRELQAKVNALAKAVTGAEEPAYIEKELAKAEAALANSEQKLNVLKDLLGYLSDMPKEVTPDPTNNNPSGDDTTGGDEDPGTGGDDADVSVVVDPVGGVTFSSTSYGVTPIILPSTTAIFGGTGTAGGEGSGVLGVRTGNPADQISSSLDSKIVNKPVAKKMIANKTNKKGTKIEDPIVPLAESPFEDSTRLNWGWLLIIFLLGATGKKMYDEYKKKQEEANAAKSK